MTGFNPLPGAATAVGLLAFGAIVLVLRRRHSSQEDAKHRAATGCVVTGTARHPLIAVIALVAGFLMIGAAPLASAHAAEMTRTTNCSLVVVSDVLADSSAGVMPGAFATTTATITNDTDVPVDLLLSSSTSDDPAGLGAVTTWTASTGAITTPAAVLTDSARQPLTRLAPGGQVRVTFHVGINADVGNAYQNARTTYAITLYATQVN